MPGRSERSDRVNTTADLTVELGERKEGTQEAWKPQPKHETPDRQACSPEDPSDLSKRLSS
jgi:hypothetical protein